MENGHCKPPANEEDVEASNELKLKANEFVKREQYLKAIEFYNKAIDLNGTNAILYSNRSLAHLRLESFGYALTDADIACTLDPSYIKAFYRRAAANFALGKFRLALRDYERVVKSRPSDVDAKKKHKECDKLVKRLAFEKAIAVDQKDTSLLATLDINSITVDASYDGPRLGDDGTVTGAFMQDVTAHLRAQKTLHKKFAYTIISHVLRWYDAIPNALVDITIEDGAKFTVCGDIHGQFYDLLNIFEKNGVPSETNPYLFNGDFVDRGSFSVEVLLTLCGYKAAYPEHVHLARGNHETVTMNKMYGFESEITTKYSSDMFQMCTELFCAFPLAHCINSSVFVCHGGLFSSNNVTLDDIRAVNRRSQPGDEGIMAELLWSDPQPYSGRSPSKRGVGIHFGPNVTSEFLANNNLKYIIRSHEVKMDGYEVAHQGKCITVFSAPNYCDQMGNMGAFIRLTAPSLQPDFVTYDAVPHPQVASYMSLSPFFF